MSRPLSLTLFISTNNYTIFRDKEASLSEQLKMANDALEYLKLESNEMIAELREEAKENEAQWKAQVNEMTVKVEVADDLNRLAQAKMHDMVSKQLELESEATEWKEKYARDSPLWKDRYEKEREYRRQEQIAARERLSKAMMDAREKLKLASEESRKREDAIREELVNLLEQNKRILAAKTVELKKAQTAMVAKDAQIEELGGDRDSLRKFAREAWDLIKERTQKQWDKVRGRVRSRKTERGQ